MKELPDVKRKKKKKVDVIEVYSLEILDLINTSKNAVFVLQMFWSVYVFLMMRTGVSDILFEGASEKSETIE